MAQTSVFTIEKDGHIYKLEAPNDTTPEDLEAAIDAHPQEQGKPKTVTQSAPTPKEAPKKSSSIADTINTFLHPVDSISNYLGNKAADYTKNTSTDQKLKDLGDVTRQGAAIATGGAISVGTKNPILGSAGMAVTDAALQTVQHKIDPHSYPNASAPISKIILDKLGAGQLADNPIAGAMETFAGNEIGGKVLGKLGAIISEHVDPGSIIKGPLAESTRTFSQLAEKGKRGFTRALEDIFAPVEKTAATAETNKVLQGSLEKTASAISGEPIDLSSKVSDTTRSIAEKIQNQEVKGNFTKSIAASNQSAEGIHAIAEMNNPKAMAANSTALATKGATTPNIPSVSGPIYLKDTIKAADQYIKGATESLTGADPDNPLFKAAQKIITDANPTFDHAGNITSADPISFKQAWQWKKDAGDLAFGSPLSDTNVTDSRFKTVYNTIDSDIENSMAQWPVKSQEALERWEATKKIVSNRYAQFAPQNETGAKVKDLLNAKDTQIDKLDDIIKDPPKLQRLLNTGDLTTLIGAGTHAASGIPTGDYSSIANTNTKKLIKGYTLSRIWQNGTSLNSDGVAVPDPRKMYQMWQSAESSPSMRMIYSSQDRANIGMFLKDLANVNQKMVAGGSTYLKLRGGMAGLTVLGGIAESIITHGSMLPVSQGEVYGTLAGGVIFSAHQLGQLLTNKNTARMMQGLVTGELSMPPKFAARVITYALRNQTINFQGKDGKLVPGKIDKLGNVQIGDSK